MFLHSLLLGTLFVLGAVLLFVAYVLVCALVDEYKFKVWERKNGKE